MSTERVEKERNVKLLSSLSAAAAAAAAVSRSECVNA